MARIRKVFSHSMTAHVWGQNSQEEGRAADGRMYFERGTLYSYGSHFAIGHIMPDGVALLNADSISISTSQHQEHARGAVSHRACYRVPNLTRLVQYSPDLRHVNHERLETRERARKAVIDHVIHNALSINDDSAIYLLTVAGVAARHAPGRFAKVKAAAQKADKARKAKEASDAIKARLADAAKFAAMTDSDFESWLGAQEQADKWGQFKRPGHYRPRYEKATVAEKLAMLATDIYRLNVAAKKHGGKRMAAKLAARLKVTRTRAKRAAWLEAKGETLARWSQVKTDFRNLAKAESRGELSRESSNRLGKLAAWLASNGRGLVDVKALESIAAKMQEREADAVKADNAKRMQEQAEKRAAWLAGKGGGYAYDLRDESGGPLLRAVAVERDESGVIVAGQLETSQGADVPLVHAIKAFRFLKLCHDTGRTWHANGHTIRVGHFTISEVRPDGFRAGCHNIGWREVARVAGELGVLGEHADDSALELLHAAA